MSETALRSPQITHISWGKMVVEGVGEGRDFKLYPGGGRAWDWRETDTHHIPGIQPSDVQELLDHGCTAVVLSRGMDRVLQVRQETIELLKARGVQMIVDETQAAVKRYNQLAAQGERVGGLFHSTC